MNKLFPAFIVIFVLFSMVTLANDNKALDQKTITTLQKSFEMSAKNKALVNALSNNDVKDLVLNRALINEHNEIYNLELDVKGITDQQSTGRCWMFAALNLMRPEVMKKYELKSFEFSTAYLFFWDKLDKANYFLETIIETRDRDIDDRELQAILKNPVPDGGWWNYAVNLIEKYGVVPKEVMPETQNSKKSARLNKTINTLARQFAAEIRTKAEDGVSPEKLRKRKIEMLKDFYRLFVLHFGMPPEKFNWREKNKKDELIDKEYTPLEFYQKVVGFNLQEYVTICDYPAFAYNDHYRINFCTNMADKPDMNFINLKIDALKKYSLKSLQNDDPVWFAADAGWQMERDIGIMAADIYDYESLFGFDDKMSKAERIRYQTSIANHGMVFVAADVSDDNKVIKWRVENSWGTDHGDKGYWAMYDNWFDKYVYTVIIHKKYINQDDLELLEKKAKRIPAWDPMRSCFLK